MFIFGLLLNRCEFLSLVSDALSGSQTSVGFLVESVSVPWRVTERSGAGLSRKVEVVVLIKSEELQGPH